MNVTSEMPPAALDRGEDPKAPRRAARRVALVGLAAVVGLALGWLAGSAPIGRVLETWFDAYVEAQQVMLEARGHVNAAGDAEYAVVLARGTGVDRAMDVLAALEGVRLARPGGYPGTVVVAVAPGDEAALARVRASPLVRAVAANRGLWICH